MCLDTQCRSSIIYLRLGLCLCLRKGFIVDMNQIVVFLSQYLSGLDNSILSSIRMLNEIVVSVASRLCRYNDGG